MHTHKGKHTHTHSHAYILCQHVQGGSKRGAMRQHWAARQTWRTSFLGGFSCACMSARTWAQVCARVHERKCVCTYLSTRNGERMCNNWGSLCKSMQAACVVVGVGVGCMQAACNPGSVQRALFQTCMLAMCRRTFLSAAAFQKYARTLTSCMLYQHVRICKHKHAHSYCRLQQMCIQLRKFTHTFTHTHAHTHTCADCKRRAIMGRSL